MNKISFSNRGFTLVEVLAAIFIIGVLSTVILLNYRTGQDEAKLTRSAAAFEADLRRAQNLAVSSTDFNGLIPCGYGIGYADNRTYSIYVGQLGGLTSCQATNHNYESGIDSIFQSSRIIEQGVIFTTSFADIFFEPPDPATYINNSKAAGVSVTVNLCLEADLTKCRNLTIDTAGRITIQ